MSAHSRPEGLRGRRRSVDDRAAATAAAQHGVITLGQVRAAGMTPAMAATRVRSGVWVRVHPGTYRVRGAPETWRQRVVAACLAGDGAASHDTALALLLGWAREPLPVEITVPATRRPRLCGVVVHRARRLEEGDLARVDGIRVTRAHRTLLDVAGRYEPDELERLLDEVLRRGASPDRLRERLRDPAARTRKGAGTLRELVEHRCGDERVTESDLETGFLQLLRRFRVPRPVSQHEVRHSGRLVARVDFAYPESRVALELDGYRWHAGRTRFDADRTRQNALEALGWDGPPLHVEGRPRPSGGDGGRGLGGPRWTGPGRPPRTGRRVIAGRTFTLLTPPDERGLGMRFLRTRRPHFLLGSRGRVRGRARGAPIAA